MQQLLVVLAVHLMSVVAGSGRAGAVPVPDTSTTLRPSHHKHPHRYNPLAPYSLEQQKELMNPDDARSERSLGVWSRTKPKKFLTCKNGWTLQIMADGKVNATRDSHPRWGKF